MEISLILGFSAYSACLSGKCQRFGFKVIVLLRCWQPTAPRAAWRNTNRSFKKDVAWLAHLFHMVQAANGSVIASLDPSYLSGISSPASPTSPSSPSSSSSAGAGAGSCSGTACYAGIGIGVGSFTLTLAAVGCVYCCRARKAARDANAASVAASMFEHLNPFEPRAAPGGGSNSARAAAGSPSGGAAAARSPARGNATPAPQVSEPVVVLWVFSSSAPVQHIRILVVAMHIRPQTCMFNINIYVPWYFYVYSPPVCLHNTFVYWWCLLYSPL